MKNPGISHTTKYPSLKIGTSHGGRCVLDWCVEITAVFTVSFLLLYVNQKTVGLISHVHRLWGAAQCTTEYDCTSTLSKQK